MAFGPGKIARSLIDPFSQATNFDTHAFERANLYAAALLSYQVQELPGKSFPQYSWSNRAQINRSDPFGMLSPASVPNAVGALLGASSTVGLPVNYRTGSWFWIGNLSQYLFVKDDPSTIDAKLKNGQPLRGLGVFSRFGYGPPDTSTRTWDASVALFAGGLMDSGPDDSFEVDFFTMGSVTM